MTDLKDFHDNLDRMNAVQSKINIQTNIDNFAIEFAEWLSMFTQEFEDGDLRYWNKDRWEIKTTKELLQIFKEQRK